MFQRFVQKDSGRIQCVLVLGEYVFWSDIIDLEFMYNTCLSVFHSSVSLSQLMYDRGNRMNSIFMKVCGEHVGGGLNFFVPFIG